MTIENFDLLRAKHQVEPWGETRADLRMETVARVIAAAHGVDEVPAEAFDYLGLAADETTDPDESAAAVRASLHRAGESTL